MARRDPNGLAARLSALSYQHGEALARARSDAEQVEALFLAEHWLRGCMAGLEMTKAIEPKSVAVVAEVRSGVLAALLALVPDLVAGFGKGTCAGCGGVLEPDVRRWGLATCDPCRAAVELGVVFPWLPIDPEDPH